MDQRFQVSIQLKHELHSLFPNAIEKKLRATTNEQLCRHRMEHNSNL